MFNQLKRSAYWKLKSICHRLIWSSARSLILEDVRGKYFPCALPDFEENKQLYSSREKLLVNEVSKGTVGCEVGVKRGNFSKYILDNILPSHLHLIDMRGELIRDDVIGNKKTTFHKGLSWEVLKSFPDECLDWVYIDAGHDYESVLKDALEAIRVVKNEGRIVFNDYIFYSPQCEEFYGVVNVVNAFVQKKEFDIIAASLSVTGHMDVIVKKMS
jgi:hypothetical protein